MSHVHVACKAQEGLSSPVVQKAKQITNPSVLKKVSVDILGCAKFFAKLALATGHYVLGESFSRSAGADTLRRAIYAKDMDSAKIPGAFVWPQIDRQQKLFTHFRRENTHTLAVLEFDPPIFLASIFGTYEAFIPLAPVVAGAVPITSDKGTVIQIELPSRAIHRYSFADYVAHLLKERT